MTKTSRMFLPVAVGLSLVALTACGGSGTDEPAALSQIDDQLWENMQAADSVTITIEPQETDQAVEESGTDGLFDGIFGVFDETIQIYGGVDDAAMAIALADEDMMLLFDQTEGYLAADALFKLFWWGRPTCRIVRQRPASSDRGFCRYLARLQRRTRKCAR